MNNEIYSLICIHPKKGEFKKYSNLKRGKLFFSDKIVDLVTGRSFSSKVENIDEELKEFKLNSKTKKTIIHLSYDYGLYRLTGKLEGLECLAVILEFFDCEKINLRESGTLDEIKVKASPEKEGINFDQYSMAFKKIYEKLLEGHTYQVNLTHRFYYKFDHISGESFFHSMYKKDHYPGAYAHYTNLGKEYFSILSNSPECLFNVGRAKGKEVSLYSMPIKGTCSINEWGQVSKAWMKLAHDKKEIGELNMITDLVRNDLSACSSSRSYVVAKRKKLVVPGLVHAHSIVATKIPLNTILFDVIARMFPGGSITGAPKLRTMKIIDEVERGPRGFYTGSTIVMDEELMSSSINIRTLVCDMPKSKAYYGAGGGVTLLSKVTSEYKELLSKRDSFEQFL